MSTLGFIGLGIMGLPMASNLVHKGEHLNVTGFDISDERRKLFAVAGGTSVDSVAQVCRTSEIIFLSLPTNELVQNITREIITACPAGAIIVDTSSSSPSLIQTLYAEAVAKGIAILDSPVSGGETGAVDGSLVIMSGGDREVFDIVLPYLRRMGATVTYMGGSGSGCTAKVVNNMIVGIHLAALGEAFCFAKKAGMDLQTLFDAIKSGFAGSAVMNLKATRLINRDYSASARIAVHQKDLKNAKELAERLGVDIPLSMMVLDYMNQMEAMGKVNEDQCAIARIYEKAMGLYNDQQGA